MLSVSTLAVRWLPIALLAACASRVASINDRAILAQSDEVEQSAPDPMTWLAPSKTDYRIGARDLLEIEVYELEESNKTKVLRARVAQDGRIRLPLIGAVVAGGRTAPELQQEIERRLGQDYLVNPSVSVLVADYQSRTVTVLGSVDKAGSFALRQNSTTLVDALAMAGGITDEAGSAVLVVRAGVNQTAEVEPQHDGTFREASVRRGAPARVLRIDLADLVERGDLRANCVLQDGDVVHVPQADKFFVTGLVYDAGSFPLKEKVTVLKAIAMAGGLKDNATPSATVLLRRTARGKKKIPVDLAQLEAGSKGDLLLQAGDVIVVSESGSDHFFRQTGELFKGLFNVGYNVR